MRQARRLSGAMGSLGDPCLKETPFGRRWSCRQRAQRDLGELAASLPGMPPRKAVIPATARITGTNRISDTDRTSGNESAFVGPVPVEIVATVVSMVTGEGVNRDLTPSHTLPAKQITTGCNHANHVSYLPQH